MSHHAGHIAMAKVTKKDWTSGRSLLLKVDKTEGTQRKRGPMELQRKGSSSLILSRQLRIFILNNAEQYTSVFCQMDRHGRGSVFREDFERGLKVLGCTLSEKEIQQTFRGDVLTVEYDKVLLQLQNSASAPKTQNPNSREGLEDAEERRGSEALARLRESFRNKHIQRIERQPFNFLCKHDSSVCRATLRKMLQRVDIVLPRNELEIIFKHIGMDQLGKIRLKLILPMNQHDSAMDGGDEGRDNAGHHSPTKLDIVEQMQATSTTTEKTPEEQVHISNMMLVKTILMREGYISRLRKLLKLVAPDNAARHSVNRSISQAIVTLIGEIKRLSEEVIACIDDWRVALEVAETKPNTPADTGSESEIQLPQQNFIWKNQNYILQMAKDMDWLQYWRKLIVSSLTDAVISGNHTSLDEILPTKLDYYVEAEFAIMSEANRVWKQVSSVESSQISSSEISSSKIIEEAPASHTFLGRLLAHASAQTAIEVKLAGAGKEHGSSSVIRKGKSGKKPRSKAFRRVGGKSSSSHSSEMRQLVAGTLALFADGDSQDIARTHNFLMQAASRATNANGSGNLVSSSEMTSAAEKSNIGGNKGVYTRMPYIGASNNRNSWFGIRRDSRKQNKLISHKKKKSGRAKGKRVGGGGYTDSNFTSTKVGTQTLEKAQELLDVLAGQGTENNHKKNKAKPLGPQSTKLNAARKTKISSSAIPSGVTSPSRGKKGSSVRGLNETKLEKEIGNGYTTDKYESDYDQEEVEKEEANDDNYEDDSDGEDEEEYSDSDVYEDESEGDHKEEGDGK